MRTFSGLRKRGREREMEGGSKGGSCRGREGFEKREVAKLGCDFGAAELRGGFLYLMESSHREVALTEVALAGITADGRLAHSARSTPPHSSLPYFLRSTSSSVQHHRFLSFLAHAHKTVHAPIDHRRAVPHPQSAAPPPRGAGV